MGVESIELAETYDACAGECESVWPGFLRVEGDEAAGKIKNNCYFLVLKIRQNISIKNT